MSTSEGWRDVELWTVWNVVAAQAKCGEEFREELVEGQETGATMALMTFRAKQLEIYSHLTLKGSWNCHRSFSVSVI